MEPELSRLHVAAIFLSLALMVAFPTAAAADPPVRDPYVIINRGQVITTSKTTLPPAHVKPPSRLTPNLSTQTDLGGGVTATSSSGLQWQESCCLRWVWGITTSQTTATIDQIETHGALIRGSSSPYSNCYEGEQKWTPSIINNNTSIADSGWGPDGGSQDFKVSGLCWLMTSGHYYVFGGARTDVFGPDTRQDF
jgi:hypothetical protein